MMEVCEVIDKLPVDRYPAVMKDSINNEYETIVRKYLVEKNDTKHNNEVRELTIETEKKYVIHRDINNNETEKYEYL